MDKLLQQKADFASAIRDYSIGQKESWNKIILIAKKYPGVVPVITRRYQQKDNLDLWGISYHSWTDGGGHENGYWNTLVDLSDGTIVLAVTHSIAGDDALLSEVAINLSCLNAREILQSAQSRIKNATPQDS